MDIIEKSQDRLVLADPSRAGWGYGLIGLGAVLAGVIVPAAIWQNGLLMGLIAAPFAAIPILWGRLLLTPNRVIFDSTKGHVEVHRRSVLGKGTGWRIPFNEIEQLQMHLSKGSDGCSDSFHPNAATAAGTVCLSRFPSTQGEAKAAMQAAAAVLAEGGSSAGLDPTPRLWTQPRPERPRNI